MGVRSGAEPNRLQELACVVQEFTEAHGGKNPFSTAIGGFTILRSDHAKQPSHRISKPALCITVQGAKWAIFGEKRYDYPAGQALVISVEMPSYGGVSVASQTEPFLGLVIELDLSILYEIAGQLQTRLAIAETAKPSGAAVIELSSQLLDCALRSLRLLAMPEAIHVLYPGIMREICYWVLTSPGGEQAFRAVTSKNPSGQLVAAIHVLKNRFTETVRLEDLAAAARMSPPTFYRQFKAFTAMTPLQYQKQLRLLEARRQMLSSGANVETAAFQVGYESSSQFSREYTRMFGRSPRRSVAALRSALTS